MTSPQEDCSTARQRTRWPRTGWGPRLPLRPPWCLLVRSPLPFRQVVEIECSSFYSCRSRTPTYTSCGSLKLRGHRSLACPSSAVDDPQTPRCAGSRFFHSQRRQGLHGAMSADELQHSHKSSCCGSACQPSRRATAQLTSRGCGKRQ
jgi:hypothetical protein